MAFQNNIQLINDGEDVKGGVINRPLRALDGNIRSLRDQLQDIQAGQTLVLRNKTVDSEVEVGQPVYYNADEARFEQGLGNVDNNELTGEMYVSASSQIWGIVLTKSGSTVADILLNGVAVLDMSAAIDGTPEAGIYWLSNSEAGKLVATRPAVGVHVLLLGRDAGSGTYEVFVNPKFEDLEVHRHYQFDLEPIPAGQHTTPGIGGVHTITDANVEEEGWLPADDDSFEGLAPEGAQFGYNLAASTLNNFWPPLPVSAAVLEMWRPSRFDQVETVRVSHVEDVGNITAGLSASFTVTVTDALPNDLALVNVRASLEDGLTVEARVSADDTVLVTVTNHSAADINPGSHVFEVAVFKQGTNVGIGNPGYVDVAEDLCVIDRNGIWWMSNCFNQVPWPTTFENAVSESVSIDACPTPLPMRLRLRFSKPIFHSPDTAVLSLRAREGSGLVVYCAGTDEEKTTGHLEIDSDSSLQIGDTDTPGYAVFKGLSGGLFNLGPVVEGVKSGSSQILVAGSETNEDGYAQGLLTLTANLAIDGAEIPMDTVKMIRTEQEFYRDTLGINFPSNVTSSIRGRFQLPVQTTLVSGTKLKLRLWFLAKGAGDLNSLFTFSYRRLASPAAALTPVSLPTSDTASSISSDVTMALDEYVSVESAAFDVETGDQIYFTVGRAAPDAYDFDLHMLRAVGVLVAP